MKKILVTGGAGFVGSNLVKTLLEAGHDVCVADNLSTGKLEHIPGSIMEDQKFKQIDVADQAWINDHSKWSVLRQKFDVIYHMAALARIQPSFADPSETTRSNVLGTSNLLEKARRDRSVFIYPGSSSFYSGTYCNPYTFTKWLGEEYCQMYHKVFKVPVGIARFFNVYGPNQVETGAYATVMGIFERQVREGQPLTVTGTGEKRRDFTHVNDIVSGLIAMEDSELDGTIYNLGTGHNHSINEVSQLFIDKFGGTRTYLPDRPGEAQTTLADISRTKEDLGWSPKHHLEEYVESLTT